MGIENITALTLSHYGRELLYVRIDPHLTQGLKWEQTETFIFENNHVSIDTWNEVTFSDGLDSSITVNDCIYSYCPLLYGLDRPDADDKFPQACVM